MAQIYVIKSNGDLIVVTPSGLSISDAGVFSAFNGTIGATTPAAGNFTTLDASGDVGISGTAATVSLQPNNGILAMACTGTTTITISSGSGAITLTTTTGTINMSVGAGGTTGTINNMSIGASTRSTGAFTTLAANSTGQITGTLTLGDGAAATAILASNLSGATDPTITFGNALLSTSSALNIGGTTAASPQLAPITNWAGVAGLALIEGDGTNGNVSLHTSILTLGSAVNDASGVGFLINNAGTRVIMASGYTLEWSSGAAAAAGTLNTSGDTVMRRLAAGVVGIPGVASTPQAVATTDGAAAAANLTTLTSTFVTGASSGTTTTLAAGTNGQIKIISLITDGGQNLVVTVTNPFWGGAGTLTFDDAGDNVMLIYLNAKWQILNNTGVTSG